MELSIFNKPHPRKIVELGVAEGLSSASRVLRMWLRGGQEVLDRLGTAPVNLERYCEFRLKTSVTKDSTYGIPESHFSLKELPIRNSA